MPLTGELRAVVLAVLAKAVEQLDDELRGSWYTARANPDAFKAHRKGVEDLRLRFTALLTRSP